jgi:hypothetical protein
MLATEIDDSYDIVNYHLTLLASELSFNCILAGDPSISNSELLSLLNRNQIKKSLVLVTTIFTSFVNKPSEDLTSAYTELCLLLQLILAACNGKHRCKVTRKTSDVVAHIRRLTRRFQTFTFHTALHLQG